MRKSLYISLPLFALLLASCGISNNSRNESEQAEIDDRNRLLQTLNPLTGVYRGMVTDNPDGSEEFPIELNIYILEEPSGVNEAGKLRFRPALRGNYRRLDFPLDGSNEKTLVGRFYEDTGIITMFSTDETKYISLTATFGGDRLVNGELRNQRGVLGRFSVDKKR